LKAAQERVVIAPSIVGKPWVRELRWLCTRILALGILLALYDLLD
jgi:hypothetical protein